MTFLQPQVIAHKLWSVLASLAVFVEQARKDERLFVVDEKDSFESAIVRIEEDHIYNMLCALQVSLLLYDELNNHIKYKCTL